MPAQQSPSAANPNLDKVKRAYEKWNRDKEQAFEHWFDLLADEVDWRSLSGGAPGLEFTRTCNCKDDVLRYFTGLAADWEMQRFDTKNFMADSDWIVVLAECAWRHRRTGKIFTTPKADFLRFKDGKVVEVQEFYDTAAAIAATQA